MNIFPRYDIRRDVNCSIPSIRRIESNSSLSAHCSAAMSSPSISAARVEQLEKTVKQLLSAFDKPIGPDQTREQFEAIFHPDVVWRDHAFLVCRVGHEAMLGLHAAWLHCNQPFMTTVKVHGSSLHIRRTKRDANEVVRPSIPRQMAAFWSKSGMAGRQTTSCVRTEESPWRPAGRISSVMCAWS